MLSAFSRVPAYTYSERGFFQMDAVQGKRPSFAYYYGYGALRPGFVWAAEHGTVAMHSDQVVWWRDDLTPLTNPGGHGVPVEIVSNSQGTFAAFGSANHHRCYTRVEGTVPFVYGEPAYSANGRYKRTTPLTSVYTWETGQRARETDTVNSANLIRAGTVRVHPGAGLAGFTFSFTNAYPSSAPPAPKINLCR